jgi:pimeloyl-ACP methyl ester carboxylesterase
MVGARIAGTAVAALVFLGPRAARAVTLELHPEVRGVDVATVDVRADRGAWRSGPWDALDETPLPPGDYELRLAIDGGRDGATVQVPPCAGRRRVVLDGKDAAFGAGVRSLASLRDPPSPGPVVVGVGPGAHELIVGLRVSSYERRIACGERPRVGAVVTTREGLGRLVFDSPYGARGGGEAVVYLPPGHDLTKPSRLLVGLHPWNGTPWTYAAYAQLLAGARERDLVLLMPTGLGNSLYTADAEDEVMRALDALAEVVAVDPRRVSLWGASMGGAGATTVGFHHPDRFASVTSFFGDSKYDLTTYVHALLPDDAAAHTVNALDVVENAAHLPVYLIHGEDDRTSPIKQSEMLASEMRRWGYTVFFQRVAHVGHSGALVARFLPQLVERAWTRIVPDTVTAVSYRSVRPWDTGAYGVHLVRARATGDAVVYADLRPDGVHVTKAEGVRALVLDPGALATRRDRLPSILFDGVSGVEARWAQRTP